MNEAAWAALDEGQCSRNQRVFRGAEPNLLRKSQTKDRPRLAVVRYARTGRTIDQLVKVRHPAQGLPDNGQRQRMVGRRKITRCRGGSVQCLPAPKDGIEHLERSAPGSNPLNAWHQPFR
jgi:hypothetical protein